MPQAILDNQAIAQTQLSLYIAEQSEEAGVYEIDSTDDVFGKLYRVWGGEKGILLLGTFYQNLEECWISQPCSTKERSNWATDTEAINAILAA
ncbi:hypothetical protein [Nostoc sp. DedQUE07]|uniref:hypothetical protein n=1 Tax=Nostoc sp. DedQUE07 TaxID=3075392 RepID=UPI002AD1DBB9|nr:hypothetical protein [Nostoc sp. DedQUE07]MDZ8131971.1 hypothetical protein [Nostoc sp. DedQUE07]